MINAKQENGPEAQAWESASKGEDTGFGVSYPDHGNSVFRN